MGFFNLLPSVKVFDTTTNVANSNITTTESDNNEPLTDPIPRSVEESPADCMYFHKKKVFF